MLRVRPNPFLCYDKDGRLTGAVRYDPDHGRPGEVHHVGARLRQPIVADLNQKTAPARGTAPVGASDRDRERGQTPYVARNVLDPLRQVEVTYQISVTEIPHTDHHVRMLRDRALLADDEKTAKLANIPFVPFEEALRAARERLEEDWAANNPEEDLPDWPTVEELLGTPPAAPVKTSAKTAGGDA